MTRDDSETVVAICHAIVKQVGAQRFELWFADTTRLALRDGTLVVTVGSTFLQGFLRREFSIDIRRACVDVVGRELPLAFEVDATCMADNTTDNETQAPRPNQSPEASPAPAKSQTNGRRHFSDFASLVIGPCNRLAAASAQSLAEQAAPYASLLVHGPTGVGKTHVLEAIWTLARQSGATRCIYLTAEQFTSYFLDALRGSGVPSFRNKYRGIDMLLVDDLQFFAGKKSTLAELFATVDELLRLGRRVVFASDRSPAELGALGPEFVTRIAGGMVARIELPDEPTRLAILRRQAARLKLAVPDDVLGLIAARLAATARELLGALTQLHATSQMLGEPITRRMAEEALAELFHQNVRRVRLSDIERAVCDVFNVGPETLHSTGKAKALCYVRMVAMWLARKHTPAALSEIGFFFGGRSHTTVLSAKKKVDRWMKSDQSVLLADHECNVHQAIRRVEERLRVG